MVRPAPARSAAIPRTPPLHSPGARRRSTRRTSPSSARSPAQGACAAGVVVGEVLTGCGQCEGGENVPEQVQARRRRRRLVLQRRAARGRARRAVDERAQRRVQQVQRRGGGRRDQDRRDDPAVRGPRRRPGGRRAARGRV
ncbi:hypothetical protein FA95DRAFT_1563326, partial [Auriscalpium vulgare]